MTRLVQIEHPEQGRRVAVVDGNDLNLLATHRSVYGFAIAALQTGLPLERLIASDVSELRLPYDATYELRTDWRFLPAFDHPLEPSRCMVSGAGLTHLSTGGSRSAGSDDGKPSDAARIYQSGVENGRPAGDAIGAIPEWFYKGTGINLRGHGDALLIPNFALGGGEEAELAAIYVVDPTGVPRRIGFAPGNEFADHRTTKLNLLYHSGAKHRECSIGPELTLGAAFDSIRGSVSIERNGERVWARDLVTGEQNMCHSLANLEHHHFKYDDHRRPGDAHVHFLGTTAFSFATGFTLEDGDEMAIGFEGFGRPLRNCVRVDRRAERPIAASAI